MTEEKKRIITEFLKEYKKESYEYDEPKEHEWVAAAIKDMLDYLDATT